MTVEVGGADDLTGAAAVWAAATAARDGEPEPPVELAQAVLAPVHERPGSLLVVARDDGRVTAFALAAPDAEVHYVGVHPDAWGRGLAAEVLGRTEAALAQAGHAEATLWVYADNARALQLYERLGWVRDPDGERAHARSGRIEVRYRRGLSPRTPGR